MGVRIGLYGGTFDPIHHGHLISARSLAEKLQLKRVVLIPSANPPHKPNTEHTPIEHRLAMTRAAVEGDTLFEVSDLESRRDGPSFTIDTVREFQTRLGPDAELFWFIGGDSLPALRTWRDIATLVNIVTIVTATRPGWSLPTEPELAEGLGQDAARKLLSNCVSTPSIGISATEIRRRCADKLPIRYLAPESVVNYIKEHALY